MEIVFESSIYSLQSKGGISRIYNEIIPRICADENINVTLVSIQKNLQPLPFYPRLRQINFSKYDDIFRPRRIWRKGYETIAAMALNNGKNKTLHSTYFQSIGNWKGYYVTSVYDMIYEKYPQLFPTRWDKKLLEKKKQAILKSDILISISETTAQEIYNFYPDTKSRIISIPLAYSTDIFNPINQELIPEPARINFPFFLYVGSRAKYKNFKELLKAYSIWPGKQEVFLIAVGPEWESDEIKDISELGITDKVILYKNISDTSLCYLYNQASAFIYPSLFEGFGIPLLEAMACRCPIIASPIPSSFEVAANIPIYFKFGDVDSWCDAFDRVLREGKNSESVHKGLQHVKKFSWDKNALETINVYKSLAG